MTTKPLVPLSSKLTCISTTLFCLPHCPVLSLFPPSSSSLLFHSTTSPLTGGATRCRLRGAMGWERVSSRWLRRERRLDPRLGTLVSISRLYECLDEFYDAIWVYGVFLHEVTCCFILTRAWCSEFVMSIEPLGVIYQGTWNERTAFIFDSHSPFLC